MEPVKKLREIFFLHPVMEKNLSRFFKIRFILPRKSLCKLTDQNVEKTVFLGGRVVFRTPPEVVSSFREGGGGVHWIVAPPHV
jgi:hypothetical protein